MEQADRTLIFPPLAIGDKRPIINDNDGFNRESKRQCTQPFGYNHEYGSATESNYILSSVGAQNGVVSGSGNTLYQPNLDTDLPGHSESQYSSGLPLLSDLPDLGPGYPTWETYAPISGNSIESFTDESPFDIIRQTDSDLEIGRLFNGISQEEIPAIEEPNATAIKKKHAPEASNPPSLWDGYASIPLQFADDCPPDSEERDKISQEIGEPMSQDPGILNSISIGEVICNEKTYLG